MLCKVSQPDEGLLADPFSYASLLKSGEANTLAASQDLSTVRDLNDQEVQDAIEELKRSTTAIEKQTEALKLQQNAMSTFVKSNTRAGEARSHTNKSQQRKWNVEKGHIVSAVEELSQSLRYQTSDLEQQSKASESDVKQTVDSILRSDDKLLSSLQKLASDLDPVRSGDEEAIARVRELCARLIKHTVEGIRTRLDRIYLDALNNSTNGHDADGQEVGDLQEELESLYSEILPVAQMSAEQQFLDPALREVAARDGQGQERSVKAVKYVGAKLPALPDETDFVQISDCLNFLVNRIEVFLERAKEHQSHKMALQYVLDEAKKELQRPEETPSKTSSPARPNTQRRRKSSVTQSPVRARNTRRRSSGHLDEDIEPEQQLLRNLGISIPTEANTNATRNEVLERALLDRLSKLEGHANSLQSTTEYSISSHLADAQVTLQLLRDSLLADTRYHKVHFLDPEIESSVAGFEKDVLDVQNNLEAVNLQKLQARNVHRDELVERWAR